MRANDLTPWYRHGRLAVFAAFVWSMCGLAPAWAQSETPQDQTAPLQGVLERGPNHSVLWDVSPESGDLIGQVFANDSQAGKIILANCLPIFSCVVEEASTAEPDETLLNQLHFEEQPSGWWVITHVQSAHMAANLPMSERHLETRFGNLDIDDDKLLRFNGHPVQAPAPNPAAQPETAASSSDGKSASWSARIKTWWNSFWTRSPAKQQTTPSAGTTEIVQGNTALDLVAHFEMDDHDMVLLQDTGGSGCPALFRFVTLSQRGIAASQNFGTCSDIATITFNAADSGGKPEPMVSMTGSRGHLEPEAEQAAARMELHRFVLRQGKALELQMKEK